MMFFLVVDVGLDVVGEVFWVFVFVGSGVKVVYVDEGVLWCGVCWCD